jgi:hypothetical protein
MFSSASLNCFDQFLEFNSSLHAISVRLGLSNEEHRNWNEVFTLYWREPEMCHAKASQYGSRVILS